MPKGPSKSKPDEIETAIARHGSKLAAEDLAETPNQNEALGRRLDKVELLIEELGKSNELVIALSDYIVDLKAELQSMKRIRLCAIIIGISFMVLMLWTMLYFLFFRGVWFHIQDGSFKAAFVVSIMTASVVIISILLKGAFRTVAERNKDDLLPPHLKEMIDAVKLVKGGG